MTETWLALANYGFLALLYAFLFWAVRVVALEAKRLPSSKPEARLLVESETGERRTFNLSKAVTMGRLPDNDIVIEDSAISARHSGITQRRGHWWLEDLGSSNGTWLNETRLIERLRLDDGDCIRLGRTTITVDLEDGE